MTKQELVLLAISKGQQTARHITAFCDPYRIVSAIEAGFSESGTTRYREIDRALQRLRKLGKIEFAAGRWHVVVPREAVES